MLSEDAIDKLILPIVLRQQRINTQVLKKIAHTVKEIGELSPSDVYALERMLKTGGDVRKINTMLAKLSGLQVKDIKKLIEVVARDAYADVKPYYDYRQKPYIPFEENVQLQKVVKAVAKQTVDTYINLSKSQAFMIRDLKNPKVLTPTPIAKTYQSVVDEAVQVVQSGTVDYGTAMNRTMTQLLDSGIRSVTYQSESGRIRTQRLDSAVRRNLLSAVREINQGVQDETGKQFGADGKEITIHKNPAPDHAPVQGHQFTNEEFAKLQNKEAFVDVNGKHFAGFDRAIGTLNCRHFTFSIIIGVFKPNMTDEQLQKILDDNNKGYTLPNGKHLTMYECTQVQRDYELNIRKLKERKLVFEGIGNTTKADLTQMKINNKLKEYKKFSVNCGLSIKIENLKIY